MIKDIYIHTSVNANLLVSDVYICAFYLLKIEMTHVEYLSVFCRARQSDRVDCQNSFLIIMFYHCRLLKGIAKAMGLQQIYGALGALS